MNEKAVQEEQNESKVTFGFWVYLMTDCVLFATLFATYAVLRNSTFGGATGKELFDLPYILIETLLLLTSSFTAGLAIWAAHRLNKRQVLVWFSVTFLLGAAFLVMELAEFTHLYNEGHSWKESGFLSAYFTLVGTHGAHITAGLLWMGVLLARVLSKGLNASNIKKLTLLGLFWHFLDIVWIFIFSIVYLMGAI